MKPKEAILAVLTVAAGVLNAWFWKGVIADGEFGRAALYSTPVLLMFFFAILFALSSSLIRERYIRVAAAVLSLALGYLFVPYALGVAIMAAASALAAWYACEAIASEYKLSHSFGVRKVLRPGLPMFFTAVTILLSMFYFSSAANEQSSILLPKALFDAAIPFLEEPLQGIIPGFRAGASVDDLIIAFALKQSGGEIDVSELSKARRDEFISEGRKALGKELGITLTGKEKSVDVLYEAANVQVEKLAGPYRQYLPLIGAVGFFLAAKALTLPIYWITLLLVFFVVKLLVSAGVLKKEVTTIEVKRITF